jgi:hypothetical protein
MKSLLLSAGLATLLAGSALAGDAQLAAQAGVNPADYSNAQLARIIEARRDNDADALAFLLKGGDQVTIGTSANAGSAQLAAQAGVPAGEYTPAELTNIIAARQDDDSLKLNFYLSHGSRNDVGSTVEVTRARVQLAGPGVDASQYSLSELAAMQPLADD